MNNGIDYDLSACLEYNPQDKISVDTIKEVLAVWEGENDGDNWRWVILRNDGKFIFLSGGCDYTGWDCQSWAESKVCETAENAAMQEENSEFVRNDLLLQLKTNKSETWREKTDKEFPNYPKIDVSEWWKNRETNQTINHTILDWWNNRSKE